MSESQEPAINATIRTYVTARLDSGIDPKTVRAAAISAFVDAFAEPGPPSRTTERFALDKDTIAQYQRQVTATVDQVVAAHQRSQPCSQSSTSGEPAEPPQSV